MSVDSVGEHVLVHLGEVRRHAQATPRTGHAGLAVDHDLLADEALLDHRRKREQRGGGVAAGVRDELCGGDALPVQLREAVDGRLEEVGRGVLRTVPERVLVRVVQAEVGGDVYDLHAVPRERDARLSRGDLRQGREDDVHAARNLRLDGDVHARQVRQRVAQLLAGLAPPGDAHHLRLGMAVQDARELDARVPRHIDDAYLHTPSP